MYCKRCGQWMLFKYNTMQCNIELQSYLQSYAIFSHFLFHENIAGNWVSCSENRKKYDISVVEFTFSIVTLNIINKSFFSPSITKSSLDGWKLSTKFNSKIKNTSTRACPIVIPSWKMESWDMFGIPVFWFWEVIGWAWEFSMMITCILKKKHCVVNKM